jgi:hypothetical protein
MPFVNSQLAGLHFAFPDVCLTPSPVGPIPVPYPNLAVPNTAIPSQLKVMVTAMPAHNLMTTVPVSNGDNAGVALNPMSGMVMGPCRHLMGSVKTLMGGMPVSKMLCPTGQNGMSPGAFGMTLAPSQVKVMALS